MNLFKTFLHNFARVLRCFFYVLAKIPFILLIILLGFYAFLVNDQGLDMMASFAQGSDSGYIFWTMAFLFFWAGAIWNVSRILLHTANLKKIVQEEVPKETVLPADCKLADDLVIARIDPEYKANINSLGKWLPRVLAMFPYLIFVWGYIKENKNYIKEDFFGGAWPILIVIAIALTHLFSLIYRRKAISRITRKPSDSNQPIVQLDEEKNVIAAIKYQKLKWSTSLTLAICLGVFIYAMYVARSVPDLNGRPGLIIMSALIVYTFLGLLINHLSNKLRLPVMLMLVIVALFISLPRNNNHALQTLSSPADDEMLRKRIPDTSFFAEWLDQRINNHLFDTTKNNVIFLIASEGGGIRACYWTFQVLSYLHRKYPQLYDKTFAVTGASGGSVGLGFFYNYIYHNRQITGDHFDLTDSANYSALDTISSSDYLSSVTFGFVYPDLFQRVIPFRIPSFDRARFLGNSFSKAFQYHLHIDAEHSLLNKNFLTMWSGRDAYNYPTILFNSTYVELGNKAIISPFVVTPTYYSDVLDVLGKTNRSIPMKEGMVSTARFPIITPPGLMIYDKDSNHKSVPFGHLVDGGYFENTAIQTAQQTALMMKAVLANRSKKLPGKFKPVIISIRYGTGLKQSDDPLGSSYELAPVIGGYNILFRWIFGAKDLSVQLDSIMRVVEFGLRVRQDTASKHMLPLGWYLSARSREIIKKEVSDIVQSREFKASYKELLPYLRK
jgi:hypothetical protein